MIEDWRALLEVWEPLGYKHVVLVTKLLGGVCFAATDACLKFGSPSAYGSCGLVFVCARHTFPCYKIRHSRGGDFDRHNLGAATLATECVAVIQTSPYLDMNLAIPQVGN